MITRFFFFACLLIQVQVFAGGEPQAKPEEPAGPPSSEAPPQDQAQAPGSPPNGAPPGAPGRAPAQDAQPRDLQPQEEDYAQQTPFTSYGEFDVSQEEEEDTRFFQFGRLFGVSLGLGAEIASGNRGALWQGGFPLIDFKLHYWFNFSLALDMGLFTAYQRYFSDVSGLGNVDVNMLHVGIDIKYYFETQNLSAPISFAHPYILIGGGSFSKSESSVAASYQNTDNAMGLSIGGGLEFTLSPKKSYIEIEGKAHVVTFQDTYTTNFQAKGLNDLTGLFMTLSVSALLTW